MRQRDTRPTPSPFSLQHRAGRAIWNVTWLVLFRPSPRVAYPWRNQLLRLFGAKIGKHVRVLPSARIFAPWNLEMADGSCLGEYVDCYNAAPISVGEGATVSQYSFLCAASHDYERAGMPGVQAPIRIGPHAWVCADVYVAPGVTVGDGAVVGARSSVFKNVPEWMVVGGNPAQPIKPRNYRPGG